MTARAPAREPLAAESCPGVKELLMKAKLTIALALLVAAAAIPAHAQQPNGAAAGAAISSEPGKAKAVWTARISAEIVAIDRETRSLTLKGSQGNTVNVVAGDEIKNFDQIKLGDSVMVRYTEALALELRKTKTNDVDMTVREGSSQAKPGERPSMVAGREVAVVAEVVDVNPQKSTISLKGPRGDIVELGVQNPDQFKVVKKGDQVDVRYTKAIALSVEPAAEPAKKP